MMVLLVLVSLEMGSLQAQVDSLVVAGRIEEAQAVLAEMAASKSDQVTWELERLRRLRLDYPLTRQQLVEDLTSAAQGFRPEELDAWERDGYLDFLETAGEKRYMGTSVSNLFYRVQELRGRDLRNETDFDPAAIAAQVKMVLAAPESLGEWLLPKRRRVDVGVRVDARAVPTGATVRCWLAYARELPYQCDIELVESKPSVAIVSDPASLIRSLYLEAEAGVEGVDLEATYQYTVLARRPLALHGGRSLIGEIPEGLSPLLEEQPPHIVFEPELRELVERLTSGETDAAVVARRLYDWIAENVLYSYAHEYSVIRNLSFSTFQRGYGDCGELAMLYITLCRIAGIPARWQSGWWDPPGKRNMHDWTEVYLHPIGWVPVDPYMGVWAARYADALSEEDRALVMDFYFGNMDHFRLYVNGAHMQALDPPKQHVRSEAVDFQRGEVEWEGGNIYYDAFDYRLEFMPPR